MPKSPQSSSSKSPAPSPIAMMDLQPMFAANQKSLQAVAEAQSHLIERLTRLNAETFDFINRRLERDRLAANEIAACKNPQEAAEVCARFAETAIKDYSEEFGVLAGIYADQAREALEDAQHQVETVVEASEKAAANPAA